MNVKLDEGAYLPTRAHDADAGYDIRTPVEFTVPAHGHYTVDSGVHMFIPRGFCGELKSKSGLNVKHNITGEGLVDSEYTGSMFVKLFNHGDTDYHFNKGDKIIQIIIVPVSTPKLVLVTDLPETERGSSGFGSSGT